MKKSLSIPRFLLALGIGALLTAPALAAEQTLCYDDVYCFSAADFPSDSGSGVLLTQVPEDALGQLLLGNRVLRAGDALTQSQLSALTFVPSGQETGSAVISCLSLTDHGAEEAELTLKIGSGKNEPPVAEDSKFRTFKNIPGQVPLTVSDPEGDPLTVTIVQAPKRGNCEVGDDGTVTYTPAENKVGKDSFTYTVTDSAGNVSEEATVHVVIQKPSDKQTYADMGGDEAQLAAAWLREEGIYTGQTVAGQLLFGPDETVSRGEFIAMCAAMMGLDEDAEALSTGFADEDETPQWLSLYVSEALRCGYLSGVRTEGGLALEADADITEDQAVQMVSAMLGLDRSDSAAVMTMTGAADSTASDQPLTRRQAAMLLYGASLYDSASGEGTSLLSWASKS